MSENLQGQKVLPEQAYEEQGATVENNDIENAIARMQIAQLRKQLKSMSKNELVRIVIDNIVTLHALKTRMQELESKFITNTQESK